MRKSLPVGYDNFKEIIEKNLYYVDKTLFIKDLLDANTKITLFTRPRRFGKTLIQSMIRYYFEQQVDYDGTIVDNSILFTGLKIMSAGELYTAKMGQYPVIVISLKSAKQGKYEIAYGNLIDLISEEYKRHVYVLNTDSIVDTDKEKFKNIMTKKAREYDYTTSIQFLAKCLYQYHKKKVIVLIDEYDVPLENAHFEGFYKPMVQFIRSLLESVLKTNEYLEFAVITGCLRISKESIFTGLNNFDVNSVLNQDYAKYFGFTREEVTKILDEYDLSENRELVKKWYDGYLFGNVSVYNPWSIINYVKTAVRENDVYPKPYWSNTSSNSIVKELIKCADDTAKEEIGNLIQGQTITKPVHEDITYEDVYDTQDNLWNFLFFTGYLKKISEQVNGRERTLTLAVPNEEVICIYENKVLEWFDKRIETLDFRPLYEAILAGDCERFSDILSNEMMETISFYDYAENYYHGFLAGLLKHFPHSRVLSNRESGLGRFDIVLKPITIRKPVVILECKVAQKACEMEEKAKEALKQIDDFRYQKEYELDGYKQFIQYGICFWKKDCIVLGGDINYE